MRSSPHGRFLLDFSVPKPQLGTVTSSASDSHVNRRGGESKQLFLLASGKLRLSSRAMPTLYLSMSLLARDTASMRSSFWITGQTILTQGNTTLCPPCSPSLDTCVCSLQRWRRRCHPPGTTGAEGRGWLCPALASLSHGEGWPGAALPGWEPAGRAQAAPAQWRTD